MPPSKTTLVSKDPKTTLWNQVPLIDWTVHKLAVEKLLAMTDDWSVHVLVEEDVMHVSVNSGNVLASVQPSGGGMCRSPCIRVSWRVIDALRVA